MATTGEVNGTAMLLYVGGTAIGATTSHSLSMSMEARDATTKDSGGDEEVMEGLLSGEVSFDGLVAWDATYNVEELITVIEARAAVTVKLSTEVVGDPRWQFSAYMTSLEVEAGLEETVTMSGTFKKTGALTTQVVT